MADAKYHYTYKFMISEDKLDLSTDRDFLNIMYSIEANGCWLQTPTQIINGDTTLRFQFGILPSAWYKLAVVFPLTGTTNKQFTYTKQLSLDFRRQ